MDHHADVALFNQGKSSARAIAAILLDNTHSRFPYSEVKDFVYSFRNGDFNVSTCTFTPASEIDLSKMTFICFCMTNGVRDIDKSNTSCNHKVKISYLFIDEFFNEAEMSTPTIDKIFKVQFPDNYEAVRDFFMLWIGYSLFPIGYFGISWDKCFFLFGLSKTGKSQLSKILFMIHPDCGVIGSSHEIQYFFIVVLLTVLGLDFFLFFSMRSS
jgi:hypothetical protein